MNQKLKVIVTAIISFVMVTLGTLSFAATTFSDIEGHWAKTVVEEMAVKGVLNGFEDGTFRPDESVTREQFAKILVETLKIAGNTTNIKFVDIEEDRWSKDYIYRASRYLTGYENNGKYFFRPTESSVREDVAVAVVQAEGLQNEKPDYTLLNKFSDSGEISEGIKKYVAIAVKNEIMRGKEGRFDPQGNLTRAEVSQLMYNVFQKIAIGELESFSIGDVNGDGKITKEDALLLQNYSIFPEDYANEIPYEIRKNADKYLDLDQDGNIDVVDVTILKAYVDKKITQLPHKHTYKDNVCTGCKHELTILYGDAYEDGKINGKDVTTILRHNLGEDVKINKEAADVNLDGKIDIADALIVQKYIAKWADFSKLPHDCKKPYTTAIKQSDAKNHEIVYTCGCGLSLGQVTEAHELKNDKCTKCGYEKEIIYGDVNGDGKITKEDALLLQNYSIFPEDYANEIPYEIRKNADKYLDLDQDGNIDVVDVTILKAYVDKKITQLPHKHTYKDNVCTGCKHELTIIYGDVNGDGVVTAKDRLALTKYIQNQDEKIDVKAADLNLDGKIDIVDLMILKKHIAKWADFSKLPHDCRKPYTTEIKQKDEKEHEIVYTCGCGLSLGEVSEEHELKDGKCAKCGYEQKEILYGDVNGDGVVTAKDRLALTKYIQNQDEKIDVKAADLNLDGKIDIVDLMILKKHIAKWADFSKLPHDCRKPYTTEIKQKDEKEHEIVYTCGCGLSLGEVSEEHELKDGKCAKCGYEQKEIIYGDVNGDGTVDFYDVAKLNAYLKNNSTKINEKVADVNADGKITEEDATILYAYTRNEITKLPHSHQKITDGKCTECGYQVVGNISKITPTPDAELPVEPKPTPEVM